MILSNALIKAVAKQGDSLVKLPGLLEFADGPFFKMGLKLLRDKYWDQVSELHQLSIITVLEAFVADDFSEVDDVIASSIQDLLEDTWANESNLSYFVAGQVQLLCNMLLRKINS